ncbi:hypothetical protein NY10_1342 [Carnobacterium antarcticum]|nr:hypothetical protein NY10_1342 [Carnobacterium sp. CP1]
MKYSFLLAILAVSHNFFFIDKPMKPLNANFYALVFFIINCL